MGFQILPGRRFNQNQPISNGKIVWMDLIFSIPILNNIHLIMVNCNSELSKHLVPFLKQFNTLSLNWHSTLLTGFLFGSLIKL